MNIQGTGFGDNVVRNIEGKKTSRLTPANQRVTSDSVKISSTEHGLKHAEKVELAQHHVNESYYDNPQVLKEIAIRLINTLNLSRLTGNGK